jgi:hypothetical protein
VCRAYHPAAHYASAYQQRLACCGGTLESPGCVAADHTDYYEYDGGWERVTAAVAEAVRAEQARAARLPLPYRRGIDPWHFDKTQRQWSVKRCDNAQYTDALRRAAPRLAYDQRHNEGFGADKLYL